MRKAIFFSALVFAVTLAVMVGNRLSTEAMAVTAGVVLGISASLPISLVMLFATTRTLGRIEREHDRLSAYSATQPVMAMMAPPPSPRYSWPGDQYYLPTGAPGPGSPREFKIVGE